MKRAMSHSMVAAALVGLSVLTTNHLSAQDRAKPNGQGAAQGAGAHGDSVHQRVTSSQAPIDENAATRNSDELIASMLLLGDEQEVALCKLAASNSKNDKVRQFAQSLAKEHADEDNPLRAFGARVEPFGESVGRRMPERLRPQDISGQPQLATRGQGGIDFLEIDREIAQEGIDSAKRRWQNEDPQQADVAFVGMQIGTHRYMLDKQKVLRGYASPRLQAAIDKSTRATQSHLERAKDLMHELVSRAGQSEK